MRTVIILSIIFLLGSCRPARETGTVLPALDKGSLFPAFFHAQPRSEWCNWIPSPAESDSCNVSFDGFCQTRLDTVLYFTGGPASGAVVIFGTYGFDEHGMTDCHACAPVISIAVAEKITGGKWHILKFIKNDGFHGSWGRPPDYSVAWLGRHAFLVEDRGYSGQGVTQGGKTFYHLPALVESLHTQYMDDSGFREDPRTVTNISDSLVDISAGDTTRVAIITTGISYDEGKGQSAVDSSRVYILNDSNVFRPARR